MCRFILAQGRFPARDILEAAVGMSCGRTADHDGPVHVHPHGWGAVWREDGAEHGLGVHRDIRPLAESWRESPVPNLTTDFLAIHARNATLPENHGIQYTHPLFRNDELPWYFMHNGFLPTVHTLLGMESSTFDSREYFDYVIPAGAHTIDAEQALRLLDAIPPGGTSGNAIAVNSREAYLIHWTSPDNASPRYFTMQRLRTPEMTVISSEAIPDLAPVDQWEPLKPGIVQVIPITSADVQLLHS
ncbi:hypothetical protein OG948_37940 (plasmid) [Embleya sp. NBC_00888]|uniref:class II glutamine amidotransferase n=1 Tax=Embleya sp. NBC_00888 TaxID=2975960 RepID=UPI002F912127|nr:hypothetical protein OG948_37940 [Embleya sp. NBC_00888]